MFRSPGFTIGNLLAQHPPQAFAEIARRRSEVILMLKNERARREALLLADGTDRAISASDAAAERMHLALERLDAAEQQLRSRDNALRFPCVPTRRFTF